MTNDNPAWVQPAVPDRHAIGRPSSLKQVCGQDEAIRDVSTFLKAVLASDHVPITQKSLLLSGVAGIGKTTLVRIIACILLCNRKISDLQPCGECEICSALQSAPPGGLDDFIEIDATQHGGVDPLSFLVETMQRAPLGRFRVTFIDEAQRCTEIGKEALLKATEEPPAWAIFILATTRPEKLGHALLSRCTHIRLRTPQRADRLAFLLERCQAWNLAPGTYEAEALALIEARSGSSFRELAAAFERHVQAGPLSLAELRRAYPNPFASCLVCLEHLLNGDLTGAFAAMANLQGEPDEQRRRMQDFLAHLSFHDVRGVQTSHHPMDELPLDERHALINRLGELPARRMSPSLSIFLEDCARLWSASSVTTSTELQLLLTRFADTLAAIPGPIETASDQASARRPSPGLSGRRRVKEQFDRTAARGCQSAVAPRPYLDAQQIECLYEAATFLVQETGLLLNVQIALDHGVVGPNVGHRASRATTDFTRRARRIVGRRGQRDLPFLYVHEIDARGRFITQIAAHISPGLCLARFENWARNEFVTTGGRIAPSLDVATCRATTRGDRVKFHARALQRLLRGTDPNILDWDETGHRCALVNLLAIPTPWRGPIGLVDAPQRWGTSDSLAPAAREQAAGDGMGFLSALHDRAWSSIFTGWELDEHRERQLERNARQAEQARIDAQWPISFNTLVRARRAAEQAQLDARCSLPARLRPRQHFTLWLDPTPSSVGWPEPPSPARSDTHHEPRKNA